MNIKEAREIIEVFNGKDFFDRTISMHRLVYAKGFIEGHKAGVREAFEKSLHQINSADENAESYSELYANVSALKNKLIDEKGEGK